MQIPGAGYITYTGYTWERPSGVTLPGGGTRELSYDPLMRLRGISVKDPAANPVMDYRYTYDKMDNITEKSTGHGDYAYGYDELYRLSTVDNPSLSDEAYTYDGVGNRLTSAETAGAWDYTANNELTGYDEVGFEYDANGNMIRKTMGAVVRNYLYDIENRLVRVEDGSGSVVAEYYYDPFGRRLWKEAAGVRTYFCYADEGLVAEFDASGNQIKSYGYRPGSTWTTDPLFMEQGGQYYFYHNDHLGTPQQMTSVSGAVVWAAEYEAFGKATVVASSTVTNNLRFPGQYYDEEIGLHYNCHRYYDPGIGRYLEVDPLGLKGGYNIFLYADNNTIRFIDPLGYEKTCTEIDREVIPTLSPGTPYSTFTIKDLICTSITIEDTLSCACFGKWHEVTVGLYRSSVSFEVTYNCCKDCNKNCSIKKKIETLEREPREEQLDSVEIPGMNTVVLHGTTDGEMRSCSACLNGIGKSMLGR